MWSRRLRCPHCHEEFDYDFVPGMSVTALRLGTSRYMRCPLCRRWGKFPLTGSNLEGNDAMPQAARVPPPEPRNGGTGEVSLRCRPLPRFNDRRPLARWGVPVIALATVLILSGVLVARPTTAELLLVVAGAIVLGVGLTVLIGFSLPDRTQ